MVASQEFRFGLGTTCGDSTRRKPTGETPGLRSPPFFSHPVGPPMTESGRELEARGPPPHVVHIGQPSGARRTEPGSGGETQGPHAPTAPRSDIPVVGCPALSPDDASRLANIQPWESDTLTQQETVSGAP